MPSLKDLDYGKAELRVLGNLPVHVERAILDLGVLPDVRSTQSTIRVYPTAWKPSFDGEEPPF